MIASLRGTLLSTTPLHAVIEVAGIGYEVNVPVTTAEKLPGAGQPAFLHTHVVYREDSQAIYGFASAGERDFFRLLIEKVSGVGPKVALALMSHLSLPSLQGAIAGGDADLLSKCPGIGRKTAERIILDLKDKMGPDLADRRAQRRRCAERSRAVGPRRRHVCPHRPRLSSPGGRQGRAQGAGRARRRRHD